jgi:hypothetical protein
VYLHFDNTGYFLGETIWFKAYVVTAENLRPTQTSRTLYIDLLTQEGDLLETQKLRIENDGCHGAFILKDSLKAGFYEVRAYTRYMLNFGPEIIFSRVFPVYEKPKEEGNYATRLMTKRQYKVPLLREKASNEKNINISFFPEGGNAVVGLESRVAFKAVDKNGKSINVTGTVYDSQKKPVAEIAVAHNGMGIFNYIPNGKVYTAKIMFEGKMHRFNLPAAQKSGYVMAIHSISPEIQVTIKKTSDCQPETLGLVLSCRGKVCDFRKVTIGEKGLAFSYNKDALSTGVCQITLFNSLGNILSERLVFVNNMEETSLITSSDPTSYKPFGQIGLDFVAKNSHGAPVEITFSLAVRDAETSNFGAPDNFDIRTNLLITSDLKGYIETPAWYFEANTPERKIGLDLLTRIHGWRRYSWRRMTGLEPFEASQPVEKGLLIDGKVVSLVQEKAKANMDIRFWMTQNGFSQTGKGLTDKDGNFRFPVDAEGLWDLSLQTLEKNKRKECRILLNRTFAPAPRAYCNEEQEVIDFSENHFIKRTPTPIENQQDDSLLPSEKELENQEYKEYLLPEITKIKHKGQTREKMAVEKASILYNVNKFIDRERDAGESQATDIPDFLLKANTYFSLFNHKGSFSYTYKGRPVAFLLNNVPMQELSARTLNSTYIDDIEKIMIVEDRIVSSQFFPEASANVRNKKGPPVCIFLFTYQDNQRHTEPIGIRKTTFQGYSYVQDFYSPTYHEKPVYKPDHRRTLYWNPDVKTDTTGKAHVEFYNNSSCKNIIISSEGVTDYGLFQSEQKNVSIE